MEREGASGKLIDVRVDAGEKEPVRFGFTLLGGHVELALPDPLRFAVAGRSQYVTRREVPAIPTTALLTGNPIDLGQHRVGLGWVRRPQPFLDAGNDSRASVSV